MTDIISELRKDCPMRSEIGNCTPCGGFCTAVDDLICEALQNAYGVGWHDAAIRAVQAEAKEKSPCALCGYGGKHLDAPPCSTCPAHPKEADNNDPLTLDELREMAKRYEGVYVAHVDGSPLFRNQTYCAAVLDICQAFGSEVMHVHAIYGDRLTMWADDYGRTWLAYRHKQKEDSDNEN